jgi:hypothetical protein
MEDKYHTSLSMRVYILQYTKLVFEVLILHSRQRLGENVRYILICGYVSELHNTSLHDVLDVVVFDLYMHRIFMKYRIL